MEVLRWIGDGKRRGGRIKGTVALVLAWLLMMPLNAVYALPQGEEVVSGSATFQKPNSKTLKIITSDKVIVNYDSFDIGRKELVKFVQPGSSSVALNRVVGGDPSEILGTLLANGKIFLINPNGILFGKSARINTGSFLASTLDISNEDFLRGRYSFHLKDGFGPSYIINQGVIKAVPGGFIVLASPFVANSGKIKVKAGRVVVAGTSGFTLDLAGDGLIDFFIPSDTPVEGDVELSLKRLPKVLKRLVNMEGIEEAYGIEERDGVIRLVGGAGTTFQDGLVDVSGEEGGQVLLDSAQRTIVGPEGEILVDGTGVGTKGGEIRVLSHGDTFLAKGILKARGGKGGEGGFVEVSASGQVSIGGAKIDTSSPQGQGGSFLLDPEEVNITNDLYYHGGNATIQADKSITVNDGVMISTRMISGSDTHQAHLTGLSIGDSGNLTLDAPQITVGNGATLLTFANNGYTGGDITLKAEDNTGDINHVAVAKVELNGAFLRGRNVTITAAARSADEFSDGDSAIDQVLDFLSDLPVSPAGVSIAKADAEIKVGSGTRIEGGNVTLSSTANTDANVFTMFTALGVAYGESSPTAKVTVEDGASIKATGDLSITSTASSEARIRAYTVNLGDGRGAKADITLAYCKSESEATSQVESGAQLEVGGNLDVKASLTKDLSTEALGGAYEDGTVGVGVAITQSTSQVNALLDGDATVGGGVTVGANIDVEKNKTASTSAVGSGLVAGAVIWAGNEVLDGVEKFLGAHASNPDPRSNSQKVALSAAFTYAEHEEDATARIGDGAVVTSQGGSIYVESTIDYPQGSTKGIQTSSVATIDSRDTNRKEYSVAGAVNITKFTNKAQAYIGKNAVVNANKGIAVKSKIHIPYEITWHEIHGVEDITDKLNPNIGIQNGFFTTWAQSYSKGTVVGVAGTANIFSLNNTSEAYIGEGAQVNQDPAYRSTDQRVSVEAANDTQTMNLSGVFGLKGVGTSGGKTGIGGAYLQVNYTSSTSAQIKKDARVYAESLSVKACSSDRNISIAESGGVADQYSLNGTFSLLKTDVTTLAQVEDGAQVQANRGIVDENGDGVIDGDENANVFIDAEGDSQLYNIAGGITKGKNVGIGASISINEIERNTKALVGNEDGSGGGTLSSQGNIKVRASSGGQISSWSLAAALAVDTPSYSASDDPLDGVSLPILFGDVKSGISIAGDASVNNLSGITEAAIINGSVACAGDVTLAAVSDSSIDAVAGSAAVSSASGTSVGLAGSCTVNEIATTTQAYLKDATVRSSGKVDLSAESSGSIKTIAAGGSGARSFGPGFSGSVAGSVSVNKVANSSLAYLEGSDLEAQGDVSLSSTGKPLIYSVAGSVAAGGKAGAGAGIAINTINNQVESYSYESDVDAKGSLSLSADTQGDIKTVSGSVGAAPQGVAVNGSVSINNVSDSTWAYVQGEKSAEGVVASGDLTLSARDGSDILAGAGQIDYGTACGVGAAVVYSRVANDVKAFTQNADITSVQGSVALDANSEASVLAVAAGAAVSSNTFGMAGSVVVNRVANTTQAYISSSHVEADDSLVTVAQGSNEIDVYDGTFSGGGSFSVGGSATVNVVENTTDAHISDSDVEAKGNGTYSVPKADGSGDSEDVRGVAVVAISDDDLSLRTANLDVAPSASLAATVSVNIFRDNTQAYISNSQVNGDNQGSHDGQRVKVAAYSGVTSDVGAGGAAFSSTAGFGATSDTTIVENSTKAFVEGSSLDALGDVDVTSTTRERINSIVVSGTATGGVSLAGSVAVVKSATSNEAYIQGSQVNSWGNILVKADDEVLFGIRPDGSETGIIAGAASIGMLGGVGGSVVVNTISNTTRAHITNSTTNASGTTSVKASGTQKIRTYVVTGALGEYVGAAGSVAVNSIGVTTQAYVEGSLVNGDDIYTNSGQNVNVISQNTSSIKSTPGDVAAGLVGVGASIDVSSIRNAVSAYLGDGVEVSAGNNVKVSASSDDAVDSTVLAFGGGALSVQGAVSIVNVGSPISDSGSDAAQDTGDKVNDNISSSRVGDMLGDTDAGNSAKEEADQETNDLSVAQDFDTNAQFNQAITAYVGDGAVVRAGNNVQVSSDNVVQVYILSGEGSVGILGVGGAVGIATLKSGAYAYAGDGSQIQGGNDVAVKATSQVKDSSVNAYAGSAGAVGLGAAVAYLDSENRADAHLGKDAYVPNAHILTVEADMTTDIESEAFSASVGVGAVGLVDSRATEHGGAWAYLDEGVHVGNPGDAQEKVGSLDVKSNTQTSLEATSISASGGVVSVNGARAKGEGYLTSQASVMDGARIDVDGDVSIQSDSDNVVDVDATGGQGGLLTVGGTYVEGWLTNNTWSTVGSNAVFDVGGTMGLYASNKADVETSATQDSGGAVTINQVKAVSNVTSNTKASLGDGASVDADTFEMKAEDVDVYAHAYSYSKTYAAASESDATSNVNLNATTLVHIGQDASVTAPTAINLVSLQSSVRSYTKAYTEIGGGVTGTLDSTVDNNLDANSNVETRQGSKLKTRNLYVHAETPTVESGYTRIATTKANTVVYWTLEVVGEVCKWTWKILTFGLWDGHQVCDPIKKWVAHILYSDTTQTVLGHENRNSSIVFNSDVTIMGGGNPQLYVDGNGDVRSTGDISYRILADRIVVDEVAPPQEGSVVFDSPTGTISGNASFTFEKAYESVRITNDSSKDLEIGDIHTFNSDQTAPDLLIGVAHRDDFHYTRTTNMDETVVDITNNGSSNVYLNGHIDNPGGTTKVFAKDGDILTENSSGLVETRLLYLTAERGGVGSQGLPINARFIDCDGLTPSVEVYAKESAHISSKPVLTSGDGPLEVALNKATVGGDFYFFVGEGYKAELVDDPTCPGCGRKVLAYVPVESTYRLGDVLAAGDVNILAPLSVSLDVEGTVTSGLKDIDFTIGPDGDISSNLFDYEDYVTPTSIVLDDLGNKGGHINLTAGTLTGTGTLKVLDGYSQVHVVNNSDKDLVLNDIDVERINGNVTFNGSPLSLPGSHDGVTITSYGYSQGRIEAENNGFSSLRVRGQLTTELGPISLRAPEGDVLQESGSGIDAGGDVNVEAGGDFRQIDAPFIYSSGQVGIEAAGDVVVDDVEAAESIYISSGGAVSETGDAGVDLAAAKLVIVASDGVGDGDPLETEVGQLDVKNGGSDICLSNTGDVTLVDLSDDGYGVKNGGGKVAVDSTGSITVSSPVEATGDVGLTSQKDVKVDSSVTSETSEINLEAQGSIVQGSASRIIAHGHVQATAGNGSISMEDGAVTEAETGDITYTARGDISLGRLVTSTDQGRQVVVISETGSILDSGDAGLYDITTHDLLLSAATGMGYKDGGSDALELQVTRLDAVNTSSGAILLENHGDLGLEDLNGDGASVVNRGGNIEVWAKAGSPGDLTVKNDVRSHGGNVALHADRNILLSAVVSCGDGANVAVYADDDGNGTGSIAQEVGQLGDRSWGTQHLVLRAAEGINVPWANGDSLNAYNTCSGDIYVVNSGADLLIADRLLGTGWGVQNLAGDVRIENDGSILFTGLSQGISSPGDVHLISQASIDALGRTLAVSADRLIMDARQGVGVTYPLFTRVNSLEAHNLENDIVVVNEGALILEDWDFNLGEEGTAVTNEEGGVYITATSPLTVEDQVVAGGNIALTAGETENLGDNLTINADVLSWNGSILLRAGDDIIQSAHTLVRSDASGGGITLEAGYQDEDGRGAILQGEHSTIMAVGPVSLIALNNIRLARVISTRSGVTVVSEKGSILDNNGDRTNIYARGDSYLWAGEIVGRYDDPLDVKVKGGDLYVYAGGELHRISANLAGVVEPSNMVKVFYDVPPGLVLFNNRLMGGARTTTFLSATAISNQQQLKELLNYGLLVNPKDQLKKKALPWDNKASGSEGH